MNNAWNEPWYIASYEVDDNERVFICDCLGLTVCECSCSGYRDENLVDAERIIACVNACAGVRNPKSRKETKK